MKIRRANIVDAQYVQQLVDTLTVPRTAVSASGFIEYPSLTVDAYERRIQGNPHFLIAENEHRRLGFLAAYSNNRLEEPDFLDDALAQHVLQKKAPFTYVELLGIEPTAPSGTSLALVAHFLATAQRPCWTATVISPRLNRPVLTLLNATGWKRAENLAVPNSLVFRLYTC